MFKFEEGKCYRMPAPFGGTGTVKWTGADLGPNPMQWHIIKALAGLPIMEMNPVVMMQGRSCLMEATGRVLR